MVSRQPPFNSQVSEQVELACPADVMSQCAKALLFVGYSDCASVRMN